MWPKTSFKIGKKTGDTKKNIAKQNCASYFFTIALNLKSATCNLFDICGCGYLSKTTRFRKESLCCSRKRQNPLTPWCDLRQYAKGHEDLRLPKIKFESHHVCIIACVYVQYVLSCSPNPFCRDRNTLEYKSFDSACAFKSKALHVCVRYEVSVKVSYQSGQKQEHRVFRHERFWQPLPAKAVRSSICARLKYRHTTIHTCLRGYKNGDCASPPFPL